MEKRRVVVTGAAGMLAGRMLPALRDCYDLTLLDARTTARVDGTEIEDIVVADLICEDRDGYREHFCGASAVVHCAYVRVPRSGPEDVHFRAEMDNIRMAYNVYQVCLEEGVKRLVALSSNHASDYYEELVSAGKMEMITPDMRPLSPQIYGWAKSAMENLGFTFATGQGRHVEGHGGLESVHIRIGAPREMDFERFAPADLERMRRFLGAYLSARDQLQLVVKSIDAENIKDENGVPFQIFYGISGNTHRFWSIANARRVIRYEPEDDSELLFADQIYEFLKGVRQMREDGS